MGWCGRPAWPREATWSPRAFPDHGLRGVVEPGSATGMLNVLVPDVDAHHARTAAAGATIVLPPTDQPYGRREYGASDTGGRIWSFATRTRRAVDG